MICRGQSHTIKRLQKIFYRRFTTPAFHSLNAQYDFFHGYTFNRLMGSSLPHQQSPKFAPHRRIDGSEKAA
jgi:hypothetical protein